MTAPDNSVVSMITREEVNPDQFDADDRMQREAAQLVSSFQHIGPMAGVLVIGVFENGQYVPALIYGPGDVNLPFTTVHGALDLSKEFYRKMLVTDDPAPDCGPGGADPGAA